MTLTRIRQPHSYQEWKAEVIVTLCDSLQNHLYSETISHWVQHWLFSTHQVEHNQWPLLHPSSISSLGMLCSPHEGQVPDLYLSCNYQSPFHNHLYLSPASLYCHFPSWFWATYKINKPAVTQRHQSSDAKAHWLWSCTSLQQTSRDGISLISNVMCSTS